MIDTPCFLVDPDWGKILDEVAGKCMWCKAPITHRQLKVIDNSIFCPTCEKIIKTLEVIQ